MTGTLMKEMIWSAGVVHVGIMLANIPLPGRLRVRERLAGVPRFLRQIFYVHWVYIVMFRVCARAGGSECAGEIP